MNENSLRKGYKSRPELHYVAAAYLVFWLMVLVICGGASMIFHAPSIVMRILSDVCAWSPTIVLFVMYKRLLPGASRKDFFKKNFSGKIRAVPAFFIIILITGIFLLSALAFSLWRGVPLASLFRKGPLPLGLTVILSLFSGPTGEECGWRGYLRPVLQERYGFLKGNLFLGVIWAFWHTVLWFVDNEYTAGWQLAVYIIANVLVMTALNIIMAVVLEWQNHLFYAFLIHFCFNLPYCFLISGIEFYIAISVFYVLAAGIMLAIRNRRILLPSSY